MSTTPQPTADNRFILHFAPILDKISDEDFLIFCQANPDWRIERTSEGDLIIMPPTGGDTGKRNFNLNGIFYIWAKHDGTGVSFDSSTVFSLPNGAKRSPDLSWVKLACWQALSEDERRGFPPLCPDFVVELRSHTDSLRVLQEKMQEYMDNGAQLGWLIDPLEKKVYVYRPGAEVEWLDNPASLSGEPLLASFTLALAEVW
jgi:Uma2 family endonuclease